MRRTPNASAAFRESVRPPQGKMSSEPLQGGEGVHTHSQTCQWQAPSLGVISAAARAGSTLRGAEGWTVLAVRIFQMDPAVSKGEQVTTMDLYASTVYPCSRERPLRHPPFLTDKMTRVCPSGIGEGCPDLRKASSNGLTAYVPSTPDLGTCRRFEDTILRHE